MIGATTFAQKWRLMALGLVAGAGVIATAILIWIVFIIWKGGWTAAVEAARVDALAQTLIGMAILMGMSMVGLLVAGPIGKLTGRVGDKEISVVGDKDPA